MTRPQAETRCRRPRGQASRHSKPTGPNNKIPNAERIVTEIIAAINEQALGRPTPCPHPWRHTVYGADDPTCNGTFCVACGKQLA